MRGLDTPVREMRRKVFEEIARVAYHSTPESLNADIEAIPYRLVNEDTENYRERVYRIRSMVSEQVQQKKETNALSLLWMYLHTV